MPCPTFEDSHPDRDLSDVNMLEGSCPPEWVSDQMDKNIELLILDCRSPSDYQTSHVDGAIHVHLPTLMLRRLKKGNLPVAKVIECTEGKEKFNSKVKTDTVILYDDGAEEESPGGENSSVVCLLSRKLREDGCKVKILEGESLCKHLS